MTEPTLLEIFHAYKLAAELAALPLASNCDDLHDLKYWMQDRLEALNNIDYLIKLFSQ